MAEISYGLYQKYQKIIYDNLGIYLGPQKIQMLQSRLRKVMNRYDVSDYDELYELLKDGYHHECWADFIDEVTTHKTYFFREHSHFEYLLQEMEVILKNNPRIRENKEMKVWSAGCSTGEEAYTLAMVLKECLPSGMSIKILATDISNKVVKEAQKGLFKPDQESISKYYLDKYFTPKGDLLAVDREIKQLITFRTFNLLNPFPFKDKFDLILCRNVMIYFDVPVQEHLIRKFYNVLTTGGLFFIGHSETLTNKQYLFRYLKPTVYIKN